MTTLTIPRFTDLLNVANQGNPYIPFTPTPKQAQFLALPHLEVLYGGAAGPGKSIGLLMAALQYVDVPGYAALLLRRTYPELTKPEALMDVADHWLRPTNAHWHSDSKTWRFPAGATLSFGFLQTEADKYQYQSAAFTFCGFDELTAFTESQYRYLFSRLRRKAGGQVPLRMRAASNPGNIGHDWVKRRFMEETDPSRCYLPATLDDNPHLDREEYIKSLANLDPITRSQLLQGDWTARVGGSKFRREWFEVVDQAPAQARRLRYWDLAATEPKKGADPDWTAGALVGLLDGVWYVEDMKRLRATPAAVESLIKQTAALDGNATPIRIEQEPGASGKTVIDHYARRVLLGYDFRGVAATGDKEVRANPVSSAAEAGNIKLVNGPWIGALLDELEAFPHGSHDDAVDALSGAFAELAQYRRWIPV